MHIFEMICILQSGSPGSILVIYIIWWCCFRWGLILFPVLVFLDHGIKGLFLWWWMIKVICWGFVHVALAHYHFWRFQWFIQVNNFVECKFQKTLLIFSSKFMFKTVNQIRERFESMWALQILNDFLNCLSDRLFCYLSYWSSCKKKLNLFLAFLKLSKSVRSWFNKNKILHQFFFLFSLNLNLFNFNKILIKRIKFYFIMRKTGFYNEAPQNLSTVL